MQWSIHLPMGVGLSDNSQYIPKPVHTTQTGTHLGIHRVVLYQQRPQWPRGGRGHGHRRLLHPVPTALFAFAPSVTDVEILMDVKFVIWAEELHTQPQ